MNYGCETTWSMASGEHKVHNNRRQEALFSFLQFACLLLHYSGSTQFAFEVDLCIVASSSYIDDVYVPMSCLTSSVLVFTIAAFASG